VGAEQEEQVAMAIHPLELQLQAVLVLIPVRHLEQPLPEVEAAVDDVIMQVMQLQLVLVGARENNLGQTTRAAAAAEVQLTEIWLGMAGQELLLLAFQAQGQQHLLVA
jgi:hypothetical protein